MLYETVRTDASFHKQGMPPGCGEPMERAMLECRKLVVPIQSIPVPTGRRLSVSCTMPQAIRVC